jgi:hypothetical protein
MIVRQPQGGRGRFPAVADAAGPAWAAGIAARTWTELPGTNFRTWALANIPAGSYLGTNPIDSIVNAYCDPSRVDNKVRFFGGGHGDGTLNCVIEFDLSTLGYSLVGQPTPPAKYSPSYVTNYAGPAPWTYPSGFNSGGFFVPVGVLTDPADTPYGTTLARTSSHMYAAAVGRGTKTHYFYKQYAEFDAATGTWDGRGVDLGALVNGVASKYGAGEMEPGTWGIYDATTDRMFVSLVATGGSRASILVFNPNTRSIDSIHDGGSYGYINPSSCLVPVGRKLYIFNKASTGFDQPQYMNQGLIFDMDAKTFQKFTITGDTSRSVYFDNSSQETIPCWYDGSKIHRWNYNTANRAYILTLDLTPVSGTGTSGDPFVLNQTEALMSGTAPTPLYLYSRCVYVPSAGCMIVLPVANSNWWALRI